MLAYLAGIPLRLAYSRENPYQLLTNWIPEQEPYTFIRHQVTRDIELVGNVGAYISNQKLRLEVPRNAYAGVSEKIKSTGIDINNPWMIIHPCASEKKREYPFDRLRDLLNTLVKDSDVQIILTGTHKEKQVTEELSKGFERRVVSAAGMFRLEEFMALIDVAPLLLSVNSGPVHIAAALNTPVVVLYAMTNPQHTPWMVENQVFYFPVQEELKSKNEVLKYLDTQIVEKNITMPSTEEIAGAVRKLLKTAHQPLV
jgi:ADP-heptose:LPS heptosyltransferase